MGRYYFRGYSWLKAESNLLVSKGGLPKAIVSTAIGL